MRIMKVKNKKVKNKTYFNYRVNLPKEVVERSGLNDKEIKAREKNRKIIIEEKKG